MIKVTLWHQNAENTEPTPFPETTEPTLFSTEPTPFYFDICKTSIVTFLRPMSWD